MKTIRLNPIIHHGQERIAIRFDNDANLNTIVKKLHLAKWSQSNKCWHIPFNRRSYHQIQKAFSGKAILNNDALKEYMQKRKQVNTIYTVGNNHPVSKPVVTTVVWKLSKENLQALEKFVEQLKLKAYSPSTIKTYKNEFLQLLQLLKKKPVTELTPDDLKRYMVYAMEKEGIKENTAHSRLNALKFYFEQVLAREKFFWNIPRPKKPDQLPKVLGEKEIARMFNAVQNIKHKAILFTAYSAGLRVSEVVNLKIKDVDSTRMQLFIEKSKGKKDRYTGLSILLLDVLRAYLKECNPRPQKYLFENPHKPGQSYSIRSAQAIFQAAKEKAMINKNVGIHSLRHSFATHLLEKGIDIKYIKELLGHFNIKTTERYLHVKKETLINIPNVLDELNKTLALEW